MREVGQALYSKEAYKDENMILNLKGVTPAKLNQNTTWLWGNELRLSLLTLTEGSNAITSKKGIRPGDPSYYWDIMKELRMDVTVVKLCSAAGQPGIQGSFVEVEFTDNWLIPQWSVYTPDGLWQLRAVRFEQLSNGNCKYTLQPFEQRDEFIAADNFKAGLHWAIGATTVSASKSDGNYSNTQTPLKATNQFGYHRYSEQIAGAAANMVINFALTTEGGGETTAWMPQEMKMFEFKRKLVQEQDLWFSKYNRNSMGQIMITYPESKEPIPRGSGVKEMLTAANRQYSYYRLSLDLINYAITSSYDNRLDDMPPHIVIHCGQGFSREFHKCIERDAVAKGYFTALGLAEIKEAAGGLTYGNYFNAYKTIDGRTVTLVVDDVFTKGSHARTQLKNGIVYDDLPILSYTGVVLNHGNTSSGDRNIQMVYEEGRETVTGIYKGLSDVPSVWGAAPQHGTPIMSTRKDINSYEYFCSQGINITNPYTCFYMNMEFDLATL
jgi:hypothetical protein